MARESPLHLGHIRAMAVTEMGAIVAPPVLAFYLRSLSIEDIIDQIARRAIDLLHVTSPVSAAWGGTSTS